MNSEKVSIIITSYGEPDSLKRAVCSLLGQSYKDIEIVVVDDNDPDTDFRKKTQEIMNDFHDDRIIYLKHEKNKNGAAARNTGIKAAQGDYICFLDNDDFYLNKRIENAVCFLKANKNYDGMCCGVLLVFNGIPKYIHRISSCEQFCNKLLNDTCLLGTGSNIFLKKSVFDDVKGFDEGFQRFQDVEFMLRVSKKHPIGMIENVDIVKVNSGLHTIGFKKLNGATELFIDKFRSDIEQLPEEENKRFFNSRYTSLLNSAFANGTADDIEKAEKLVQTIRPLSGEELNIKNHLKGYRRKRKLKEHLLTSKLFYAANANLKKKQVSRLYEEFTEENANEIKNFLKNKF